MSRNNTDLAIIRHTLESCHEPILIFSHPSPDGDSVGSTIGLSLILKALGKRVFPVVAGQVPATYRFLVNNLDVLRPPVDVQGKMAVVLDCSDLKRLEQTGQTLAAASKVINLDHHLNNEYFGAMNYVDPSAAAVGLIIYEMFSGCAACSKEAALALFTALYTDTGRFSYSNTDARCLKAAAELVRIGADPQTVFNEVYQNKTLSYYKLLAQALGSIEMYYDNQAAILQLTNEDMTGNALDDWETEDLNDYPRSLGGVLLSAILKETEEQTVKISLRSKGKLNVAAIAKEWGGGGHQNAAGATLAMSLSEAKKQLICRLEQEFVQ